MFDKSQVAVQRFFRWLKQPKKWSTWLKLGIAATLVGGVLVLVVIGLSNVLILGQTQNQIFTSVEEVSSHQTALILGAKVHDQGRLSDMLRDRTETAYELYQAKKVSKLLVSGDHGRQNYDEVNAIKDYLLAKGVPPADIFLDHAGFDTYDSLYRAKAIFGVESLVIVTQGFHLPRAVFLANALEIKAVGVVADKQEYWGIQRATTREYLARVKALLDVTVRAKPTYLGESIPITGPSQPSWDQPQPTPTN